MTQNKTQPNVSVSRAWAQRARELGTASRSHSAPATSTALNTHPVLCFSANKPRRARTEAAQRPPARPPAGRRRGGEEPLALVLQGRRHPPLSWFASSSPSSTPPFALRLLQIPLFGFVCPPPPPPPRLHPAPVVPEPNTGGGLLSCKSAAVRGHTRLGIHGRCIRMRAFDPDPYTHTH